MDTAHNFYEKGLGLVYDPSVRSGQKKGVGVSWLNIGDQQVFAGATFSIKMSNFRLSESCRQWTARLCDGLHVCIYQSVNKQEFIR